MRASARWCVVIGGALAFLVVWLLLVRPAWTTLDNAPALRAQADAQLLQMQAIANEAKQLRALPPVPQSVAEQVLKSATDDLGGKAKLAVQGERATLSVTGINGEDLRTWLLKARGGARARPIEAIADAGRRRLQRHAGRGHRVAAVMRRARSHSQGRR